MASVYGNATLTVAFTDNVKFGTKVETSDRRGRRRELGDLDTRGWVLQEQFLSQRVLSITKYGLFGTVSITARPSLVRVASQEQLTISGRKMIVG